MKLRITLKGGAVHYVTGDGLYFRADNFGRLMVFNSNRLGVFESDDWRSIEVE